MLPEQTRKQSRDNEWTPLNSRTNSIVSNEANESINIPFESYGAVIKLPDNYRELNYCDLIVFFIIFWNIYASRKLLYPFTTEFSEFYGLSLQSFSYILSSYDIGGFLSIIISCFPPLHNVRIYILLFCIMISVVVLYTMLAFSDIFITLFIIRFLIGFIFTITQAQVRGAISTFLKSTNSSKNPEGKLGSGLVFIESAWFFSTINWVLVGLVLNQFSVVYIWYLMGIYSMIGAMSSYFLPSSTISQVLAIKKYQSVANNSINVLDDSNDNKSLLRQYHLHFFFIGYMIWSIAFNAYFATFGAWITMEFDLNPEQLGINTIVISCGECLAFIIVGILQKYFKNVTILLVGVIGCISIMTVFMLLLKFNFYTQTIIWTLIFGFTLCSEISYLNLLIVNLYITPKGLETRSSLTTGVCSRLGTVLGVIGGPKIVKLYGFSYLIQMIGSFQFAAFILFCISFWRFNKKILRLTQLIDYNDKICCK